MTGVLALLISWLTGYFALKCLKEENSSIGLMDIFIMTGLGFGITAQIVFYSLLIAGRIDPVFLISIHLFCLSILFFFSRRFAPPSLFTPSFTFQSAGLIMLILLLAALIATITASLRPWGDWDGWSYWNFQSKFLFNSGYEWYRFFDINIQAHHPWSLPLVVIWGWCFDGREESIVPMSIGIIFTVSTVGLLIGALKKYVPLIWAATGGLLLSSIPFYMLQGTSQYADIEAAYFILLSLVLALNLIKNPSVKAAALTGLSLGLSCAVKDNSIAASILLMILIIVSLNKTGERVFIRPLSGGFIATAFMVVLMKLFDLTSFNNHSYDVSLKGLCDIQKWVSMGQFALKTLTDFKWGGLWPLALAVLTAQYACWRKQPEMVFVQFIFFYLIFYFFTFAASVHRIEWLLGVAFDRLLYLLAPSVVFIIFYAIGKREHVR